MIRYIFTKNEIMTLFYMSGYVDYKCSLFDVMNLNQSTYNEALDGLIEKNVIYRINNKEIKVDKMFVALVTEVVNARYTCEKQNLVVSVGEIVIVFEEDLRNQNIIKMTPYKTIEDAVDEYGTDILL